MLRAEVSGLGRDSCRAQHGLRTPQVAQCQLKVGLVTNRHDESQIRGVQGCLIVHIHMGDVGL